MSNEIVKLEPPGPALPSANQPRPPLPVLKRSWWRAVTAATPEYIESLAARNEAYQRRQAEEALYLARLREATAAANRRGANDELGAQNLEYAAGKGFV